MADGGWIGFVGGRDVGFSFFPSPSFCQGWGRCIFSTTNHTTVGWKRARKYTLCSFFPAFETNDNGKSFHLHFSLCSRIEPKPKQPSVYRWSSTMFLRIYRFSFCTAWSFFLISKPFFVVAGFPHHLPPAQAHLTGTPDWRVLNNRPFPPSQYFHHHPHFATHNVLAAIDRMERPFLDGSECRWSQAFCY